MVTACGSQGFCLSAKCVELSSILVHKDQSNFHSNTQKRFVFCKQIHEQLHWIFAVLVNIASRANMALLTAQWPYYQKLHAITNMHHCVVCFALLSVVITWLSLECFLFYRYISFNSRRIGFLLIVDGIHSGSSEAGWQNQRPFLPG